MNGLIKKHLFKTIKILLSIIILVVGIVLISSYLKLDGLSTMLESLLSKPHIILVIFLLYGFSFYLKALAWNMVLPKSVTLHTCLIGLFYNLLINHLSPFKVGDFVRAHVVSSKDGVPYGLSLNSVVWMRILDMVCLLALASLGVSLLDLPFVVPGEIIFLLSLTGVIGVVILYRFIPSFFSRVILDLKKMMMRTSLASILLILLSWIMEATVIWGILLNTSYDFSFVNSVWVNSITIMGQLFQITPGGIATYETTMGLALRAVGIDMETSVHAAVISHVIKFVFSFVVGSYALLVYPLSLKNLYKKSKHQE